MKTQVVQVCPADRIHFIFKIIAVVSNTWCYIRIRGVSDGSVRLRVVLVLMILTLSLIRTCVFWPLAYFALPAPLLLVGFSFVTVNRHVKLPSALTFLIPPQWVYAFSEYSACASLLLFGGVMGYDLSRNHAICIVTTTKAV